MTTQTVARRPVPIGALLLLFVLSGAAGLIYEVVWARQLVLVFGNTSQAVSTILTGFFGGLAIGGVLRRPDRRPRRAAAPPVRRSWSSSSSIVVLLTPITFRLIGDASTRASTRRSPSRRSPSRWSGSRSRSSPSRRRRC